MKMLVPLLLLVVAACGGPPYRAREKSPDNVATPDSTVLVVMDDTVKWGIELVDHEQETLPDGRMRARLRFTNRTPKELEVQYAWTFKDDRGFNVEGDSPFEHLILAPGQTVSVTRDSRSNAATAFHVQMKTAKSAQD